MTKKQKIFSVPLNPMMPREVYEQQFIPWVLKHKDYIYDFYFTLRIAPFYQDSMGSNFSEEQIFYIFQNALATANATQIPISATLNNIHVPPTMENLDMFIENFRYMYNAGVKSVTLPHSHWLMTGKLQKEFPELQIKNTILRKVDSGQEFWDAAVAGFDYVNLDRNLMRDYKMLKDIKKAQTTFFSKTGKYVKISLLANEGCRGKCPVMDEHYTFNNFQGTGEPGTDKPYFYSPIGGLSCMKWKQEDRAYDFRTANFVPYRTEFEEILEYVDVIKMHGRESLSMLESTMKFITSYADTDNEELSDISMLAAVRKFQVSDTKVAQWRKLIKNCKFECWDCNYCDQLVDESIEELIIKS